MLFSICLSKSELRWRGLTAFISFGTASEEGNGVCLNRFRIFCEAYDSYRTGVGVFLYEASCPIQSIAGWGFSFRKARPVETATGFLLVNSR